MMIKPQGQTQNMIDGFKNCTDVDQIGSEEIMAE